MIVKTQSQVKNLIEYLQIHGYITQLVARQVFGIERLASRITDLRKLGHKIHAQRKADVLGKRYTQYYLVD